MTAIGLILLTGITAGAEGQPNAEVTALGGERGPKGEVPLAGVSDRDIFNLAESTGMSQEESRFILFEGSEAIVDFIETHKGHNEFGGIEVLQDGKLEVRIRTTTSDSQLSREFEKQLGRSVEAIVGGQSFAQTQADYDAIEKAMEARSSTPQFNTATDFATGRVHLNINASDRTIVSELSLPSSVVVETDLAVVEETPLSFAGINIVPSCTVGFAAKTSANSAAIFTAGHCSNVKDSAYGYSLGNAFQINCSSSDRQVHLTAAPYLWYGFYNFSEQWTNIYAVAGGWYPGQNFFRRGANTKAVGTISDLVLGSAGGSGDCGSYTVSGFVLYNYGGAGAIPGDSGGPLMLAYGGKWYLGGMLSTSGPPGSSGRAAWRDIPAPWTACTQLTPCGSTS